MKIQPSDPRKASRFEGLLHQSWVLCGIFLLSRSRQTFTTVASVHGGWAPHGTGQVLGLLSPWLVPFIPKSA